MAERVVRGRRHRFDAFLIAHIKFQRDCPAPQGFNLGLKRREGGAIAAGKDEVCTSLSERARESLSKSATGSGDDRHASAQIEEGCIRRGLIHNAVPGVSTTFIKFGSRAYRRSNH